MNFKIRLSPFVLAALLGLGLACEHGGVPLKVLPAASPPAGSFATGVASGLPLTALTSESAVERLTSAESIVHDARLAREMERRDPQMSRVVRRGVLARALLAELEKSALKEAPLTEADLERAREAHFLTYNRPRAVRTAQAFISVPLLQRDDEQYALAQKVHEAVQGAPQLQAFAEAAQAAAGGAEITLWYSPPVAADGRIVPVSPEDDPEEELPQSYAKAAAELTEPGQISGIVGSEAGFHILFATEIIPALRPEGPEIRRQLQTLAASSRLEEKLRALHESTPTEVRWIRTDLHSFFRTMTGAE